MTVVRTTAFCVCLAGLLGSALGPVYGQGAPSAHPWLDPTPLAAALPEGSLIVYSSMNEQEGLPLFKIFEEARPGSRCEYIRNADLPLMSRGPSSIAPIRRPGTCSTPPRSTSCRRRCWRSSRCRK